MFSTKGNFLQLCVKNPEAAANLLGNARWEVVGGNLVARARCWWDVDERKAQAPIFKQVLAPNRVMDGPTLKRAGTLLFVGAGQFAFFLTLAEIYYRGYDVSLNTISDLGATCRGGVCEFVQPSSDIFNASVVLLGILLVLTAYYLWKGAESKGLSLFQLLVGIGAMGIGIFNESYGVVHVFFSAFAFVSAGIQALLVFRVAKAPYSYFSMVTGIVTIVATVLYATDTYLGLGQGGMERMVVYPVLIGGIAFGGYLMAFGDAYLR
jgi:hypothetical membrane protein